jgi:hypothetical protein
MSAQRNAPSSAYVPPTGAEHELTRLVTELLRRAGDPFGRIEIGIEAKRAQAAYDQIRRTLDHDHPPFVAHEHHHGDGHHHGDAHHHGGGEGHHVD